MKFRPAMLYILFFIGMFFVFLFLLFPQKQMAAHLSAAFSASHPEIHIRMDNVVPSLPFALTFDKIRLSLGQTVQIIPDRFKVFFPLASMFNKEKQIKFKSDVSEGFINGSLYLNSIDPLSFSQGGLVADGIKVTDFRYKTNLADMVLSCEFSGDFLQEEARSDGVTGNGMIMLQDLSVKMNAPFFNRLNLSVVEFKKVMVEFSLSSGTLKILTFSARGPVINVELSGTIQTGFSPKNTRLKLGGLLLPDSPYLAKFINTTAKKSAVKNLLENGVRFSINGTLKDPKIGI